MQRRLFLAAILASLTARAGEVPRPAPPLDLLTPGGERISLSSLRGKVVLVKFFLTECPHCQKSASAIMPIYKEWRSRGLEVVGVAINPDAAAAIPQFAKRFGVAYPMAAGNRNMLTSFADISAVARFYVPYLFLVDRQGVIRYEHSGGDQAFFNNEAQNLRAELGELLKETAQARKGAKKPAGKS